jgi:transcriptional regulator with XRE-family HTH domain
MPTLQQIVRTARAEHRMSLVQFATAVGLSENTVAAMEYGGRPSLATLEKLATFLRRPVSDLCPEHASLHRRGGPRLPREAEVDRTQELVGRLTVLHAEFNTAHERAIAAIRASNGQALLAARQQQAEILSRQDALIHRYDATVGERSDRGGVRTSGSALGRHA